MKKSISEINKVLESKIKKIKPSLNMESDDMSRDEKQLAVYDKFPEEAKSRRKERLNVMLEGPTATALDMEDYDIVVLNDLEDSEIDKLYNLLN